MLHGPLVQSGPLLQQLCLALFCCLTWAVTADNVPISSPTKARFLSTIDSVDGYEFLDCVDLQTGEYGTNTYLGIATTSLLDLNGDGAFREVAVGSHGLQTGSTRSVGGVFVMFLDEQGDVGHYALLSCGRGQGMPSCADPLFPGSPRFGSSLALLGDVDGNGVLNELAVGAVGYGASYHGAVYLLRLDPTTGSAQDISIISNGAGGLPTSYLADGDRLGYALAWIGDLDGDGQAMELAVGAYDQGVSRLGYVLIMWLNAARTVSQVVKLRNGLNGMPAGTVAAGAVFGASLAFLGDLDGDGDTLELAAGLRGANVGEGALLVFQLRRNGTVSNVVRTERSTPGFAPDTTFDYFGFSLDWLGDFDGDGNATELAVGGEGLVIVSLDPATLQPRRDRNATAYTPAAMGLPGAGSSTSLIGQVGSDPKLTTIAVGAHLAGCSSDKAGRVATVRLHSPVGARWGPPATSVEVSGGSRPMGGSRINITFAGLAGLPLEAVKPHVGGLPCNRPTLLSASELSCSLPLAGGSELTVQGSANGSVLDPPVALEVGWRPVLKATSVWSGGSIGSEALVNGAGAGASIAFVGDLDRDGVAGEFLVGIPGASTLVSTRSGAVVVARIDRGVVRRSTRIANGVGGLAEGVLSDESAFGSAVAWVGDLHRTGEAAVVAVGAPGDAAAGAADSGAVYIMTLESQTGQVLDTTKLFAGAEGVPSDLGLGSQFGAALASAPDPRAGNADPLLLVGAPQAGTSTAGALHILSLARGQSPPTLVTAAQTISGGGGVLAEAEAPAGSLFGAAVAWVGDLDGDAATCEFAVGAPGRSDGGALLLFRLGVSGVVHLATVANGVHLPPETLESAARFGRSISWLGDDFDDHASPGSLAVGVDGGLAIVVLDLLDTDRVALQSIQLLDATALGLGASAATASLGAAVAALGSAAAAGGDRFSLLVAAPDAATASGAAWLVELDAAGANASAEFATGAVPQVRSAQPSEHLSWLGTSTITVVGTNFTRMHPLLPPAPHLYFPARLAFSGPPANQSCVDLQLSELDDGATALSCKAPPALVTARNATVQAPDGANSEPFGVSYDVAAEVSAAEVVEPLDQAGGRSLAFTGIHLLPSSVFSDEQLARAGVGIIQFGDKYTCPFSSVQRSADGGRIECTNTPRGVGGPHPVRLLTAQGTWSASSASVTYVAPTVVSIEPGDVRLHANASYAFEIRGTGFGSVAADVTAITIGGNPCTSIDWNSSTLVRCASVKALFSSHDVVVTTDRVPSNGGSRLLVFPDPPRVVGVTPAVVPTVGGTNITCFGTDYEEGEIASVLVGGKPCSHWALVSSFGLLCTTPPGTGRDMVVTVVTAGGIWTPSVTPLLSFAPPTISALDPGVAFSNPLDEYTFSITGTGFGVLDGGQVTAASVGGKPCGEIEHIDDAHLLCRNVSAPWHNRLVRVVVSGQEALQEGLFDFQPRPEVTGLLPSRSPTAGGIVLTVAGKGFGGQADDIDTIYVGARPCPLLEHVSAVTLRCSAPAGVGSDLAVQVVTVRNGASPGVPMFSYNPPQVTTLGLAGNASSTADGYVFVGTASVDLVLSVADAGDDGSDLGGISLRMLGQTWSSACRSHEVGTSDPASGQLTTLLCRNVSLAGAPEAGGMLWARVEVGGQTSSQPAEAQALLTAIGRPTLSLVTPSTDVPTTGLGNATAAPVIVVGANLGSGPGDVLAATLDGEPCPLVVWESSTGLRLALPAGVGARRGLRVQTRGGLWTEPFPVSYRRAEPSAISPNYVFTGSGNASFDITGVAFGLEPGHLTGIAVGGRPCGRSLWVSSSLVRCVDTPRASWESSSVLVTVGGQLGIASNLLTVIGQPRISIVSPTMAAPGDDLLLLGSGFGEAVEDIRRITVAGEPCVDVKHPASAALSCTMPSPPQQLQLAAVSDPRLLLDHDVVVTTDGGMSSLPAKVSFQGGGTPISAAPSLLRSWRPVEQPTTIVVRWAFPAFDQSDGVAEIESFDIQLSLTVNETTTGLQRQQLSVAAEAASPSRETSDGFVVYEHSDFVFATEPVEVQVRARNPTGPGPWSEATPPVPQNCGPEQFLEDNVPVHEWQCQPCPVGAFCGGAGAGNVTALGGFWRLPWSRSGLGFAQCTFAGACLGSGSSSNGTSDAGTGSRRLQVEARGLAASSSSRTAEQVQDANPPPTATPASRLANPLEEEDCNIGYSGTMCAACMYGFARWGAAQCARCKSGILVGLALVGIAILLCAVISYLVLSALRSGQQDKSMTTAVIKILFSHVQTVAIAAAFDLEWPDSVLALFATMTSATSVSSDVLSLDCVMNGLRGDPSAASGAEPGRSLFFEKAAVVLAMPLLLVCGAAIFWTLVGPVATRWCCLAKAPGLTSQPMSLRGGAAAPGISSSPGPAAALGAAGQRNPMAEAHELQERDLKAMLKDGLPRRGGLQRALTSKLSISAKYVGISLSLGDKLLTTTVVIMFLVHMSVTQMSLQLLTCVNVVADGIEVASAGGAVVPAAADRLAATLQGNCNAAQAHRRLLADLEVCCYDPEAQRSMYGLGIPGLLVYAVGIPLCGALLLFLHRHQLGQLHTKVTLGFIYAGFREEAYYWESVVMLRKVGVAAVGVLMAPLGPALQTYAALLLIFVLALVHQRAQPYALASLNHLELGALVTAYATFECGLFLTADESSRAVKVAATLTIMAVNMLFLACGFAVMGWDTLARRCRGRGRRRPLQSQLRTSPLRTQGASAE